MKTESKRSSTSMLRMMAFTAIASSLAFTQNVNAQAIRDWPATLGKAEQTLNPNKSYAVLVSLAPTHAIDFRSAEKLHQGLEGAGFGNFSIGHKMVGWRCVNASGQLAFRGFTALTGESSNQSNSMVLAGWGMTPAVSTFTDGHLQSDVHVEEYLNKYTSGPAPKTFAAALFLEIEPQACLDMVQFVYDFSVHPNQPATLFGLGLDPLKFEGGGCGSYALGTLHFAQVIRPFQNLLWRELQFGEAALGRKQSVPNNTRPYVFGTTQSEKNVSLSQLLAAEWDPKPTEPIHKVKLVDPEMVLLMQGTLMRQAEAYARAKAQPLDPGFSAALSKMNRSVRSCVRYHSQSAADELFGERKGVSPCSMTSILIDAKFDAQAGTLVSTVSQWWNKQTSTGMTSRSFSINGGPGLILENIR